MRQIMRHILTYICLQLNLSLAHQINLTVLLRFVIYKAILLSKSHAITSLPVGREAVV